MLLCKTDFECLFYISLSCGYACSFFFFFFFVMNGHKVFSMYVCMQCSRCVVFKQEGINFDLPQSCISILASDKTEL